MPLTKLTFRPGINRETTSYSNEGGWFDCDKVRFRMGYPEKIGGWQRKADSPYLGIARSLFDWTDLGGARFISIGTNLKFYIDEGDRLYDVTPLRETTAAGGVTLSASANTLNGAIDDSVTTITLTDATGFPTQGLIEIDSEQITYAGVTGNDLTGCVRGVNGTTAAAHSDLAAVGCATIIASDITHGAAPGDFFTLSGAVTLGGNITADVLNQEFRVLAVPDSGTFYFNARTVATSRDITLSVAGWSPTPVFANASDTGNGGASIVGEYQITTGQNDTITGTGWGAGVWSRLGWGDPVETIRTAATGLRLWSQDNYGEDLVVSDRNGGVYYWDRTNGVSARLTALSELAGAQSAPTIARQIMVSDRDRHVIAFGCDPELSPGVQDPLTIRFSDQESVTDWRSLPTNTAGEIRLGRGTEIIQAVETRHHIAVFTDIALFTMQYLGPPFTFGVEQVSANISIAGPNAGVGVDDNVYWMGTNEFYVYDGSVRRMPSTVRDYVYTNINETQMEKVVAASNAAYSEVWWFYPSASSSENDRYVVYNYQQDIWYIGSLRRSSWIDRGSQEFPLAANPDDNYLYFHENGIDDGTQNPAVPLPAYIESSQMDIGDGEQFSFIRRVIPDLTFRDSSNNSPVATFTIKARRFPGTAYEDTEDNSVTQTVSAPVELFTDQLYTRVRGRSFAIRVASDDTGVAWRLGSPRVDIRTDGKR